jgi:hypothetical protein
MVKGEDVGSFMEPNIDVIMKADTPSPFGCGEETVMDPSYRNNREIHTEDIDIYQSIRTGSPRQAPCYHTGYGLRLPWEKGQSQVVQAYNFTRRMDISIGAGIRLMRMITMLHSLSLSILLGRVERSTFIMAERLLASTCNLEMPSRTTAPSPRTGTLAEV